MNIRPVGAGSVIKRRGRGSRDVEPVRLGELKRPKIKSKAHKHCRPFLNESLPGDSGNSETHKNSKYIFFVNVYLFNVYTKIK